MLWWDKQEKAQGERTDLKPRDRSVKKLADFNLDPKNVSRWRQRLAEEEKFERYKRSMKEKALNAIVYAIKTGEFLLKAKAKVPHGGWEIWFKSGVQLPFSDPSQARRYMKLAKNKSLAHIVNDANSQFNLEDINKAIANASDEEQLS